MQDSISTMTPISTYVFFDIVTTGVPYQEKNRTKIIELSLVSALREDIERTPFGHVPLLSKLSFVLNPNKNIHSKVKGMTGLSKELLKNAPIFSDKIKTIISFLEDLRKPVCLVAHNGNAFDFKILLAECNDAKVSLPSDLLCLDSLIGFKKLLKGSDISYKTLTESRIETLSTTFDDILTDDEGDWPDFNLSPQEWQEIDNIVYLSFPDIFYEKNPDTEPILSQSNETDDRKKIFTDQVMEMVLNSQLKKKAKDDKKNYTLSALYKRLLNKEELNAHGAEVDCLILLQCVVALKTDFLSWADSAHRRLCNIKPLIRH